MGGKRRGQDLLSTQPEASQVDQKRIKAGFPVKDEPSLGRSRVFSVPLASWRRKAEVIYDGAGQTSQQ